MSVLTILMTGEGALFASGTRMKSLGMDANTYWMLQKDTAYANYNPAYYSLFPGRATFNEAVSGGNQSPTAGIWLKPVDEGTVVLNAGGTSMVTGDTTSSGQFMFSQLSTTALTSALMPVRENYNVAVAYKMGAMAFGLRYGSADRMDKTNSAGASTTNEKAIQTVAGGFLMDLGSGMDFDVAAKYTTFDYKVSGSAVPSTNTYKANSSDFDVMARFNMKISETNSIHVWARFNPMDRTDKLGDAATAKTTYTIQKNTIGISDELLFTQKAFAYFGFLYDMIGEDKKQSGGGTKTVTDTTNLSFYMGAQANLTKNLTMTMGSNRLWNQSYTQKVTTAGVSTKTEKNTDGSVTGSWGLQYKMGHWSIEGLMRRELWTNGPFMISGNTTTGGWASEFNITYVFGTTAVFDEEKK